MSEQTFVSLRLPVALLRLVDAAAGRVQGDGPSLRSRWIRNAMRRQLEREGKDKLAAQPRTQENA